MTKRYRFETDCVHSTAEWIDEMTERAVDVTYRTVLRHCEGLLEWAQSVGYVVRGDGLKLKDDWHVGFHKSVYRGKPCYYVQWSGIEHIWTLVARADDGRRDRPLLPVEPTVLVPAARVDCLDLVDGRWPALTRSR